MITMKMSWWTKILAACEGISKRSLSLRLLLKMRFLAKLYIYVIQDILRYFDVIRYNDGTEKLNKS